MMYNVTIHSCRQLDGDHKTDPYVEAMCGKTVVKTPKKKNAGTEPVFMCNLQLPFIAGEEIRFAVKDDGMLKDSVIGTGAIHEAALVNGRFEGEIPLTSKKGKDGGRLRVTVVRV